MRWPLLILLTLCTGCPTPRPSAPPKSDSTKGAVATVGADKASAAAAYVAGSTQALASVTNPPPAVAVARQMNTRAAALLPAPSTATALEVSRTVEALTSELAETRASGAQKLAALDAEAASLAKRELELRAQLQAELEAERAANAVNAADAGEWRAHKRKEWFARLTDLFGSGGLVALAVAFPALAPLTGRAFGLLSKVMPSSAVVTGVVSRSSFDGVVAGVERVRQAIRSRDGETITAELAEQLDGLLREERNREDLPLIRERRHRTARRS